MPPNNPKGNHCTVDPIRTIQDIARIKCNLQDNPRNLLLFTMGINSGIRTGDLLKLTVNDMKHYKNEKRINIIEGKTGKPNVIIINDSIEQALDNYFWHYPYIKPHHHLFWSGTRKGHALGIQAVNALVKKWTKGMPGNYGAHTLRKTFGYMQRIRFGTSFEVISKRYNHSNPAITMRYVGITDLEVEECLSHSI